MMQHNFKKKTRNNLEHSRTSSKKPLMLNGKHILWDQLYEIYQHDQTVNPVPIYMYKQIPYWQSLQIDILLKMRNHLADQVLNNEMLSIAEVGEPQF